MVRKAQTRTIARALRAASDHPSKEDIAQHAALMTALREAYRRGWAPQALVRVIADDLRRAGYPPITAQDVAAWVGAPEGVIDRTDPPGEAER